MNKQELKDKITERIGRNLYYMSCVVTNDNVRKEFAANNDILNELLLMIKNGEDVYEKGLNDAWELAHKIVGEIDKGGYTMRELSDTFGICNTAKIFSKFTYSEALAKIQEYEKKEEIKLVPGDVVTYMVCDKPETAIFLDECVDHYWVLSEKYTCPQRLCNQTFSLVKTGKHVDIEGLFEGIKDE